jgi:hypothetical protein
MLRRAIGEFAPDLALLPRSAERWVPRYVALVAVLMALGAARDLAARFARARDTVASLFPSRRRPGRSIQGFNAALAKQSPGLVRRFVPALRRAVVSLSARHAEAHGFVPIGVDGSRVECPMTLANEAAFGIAGKAKTGPQQFLTTAFCARTGLLWDFRRGDARSSERSHLLEMLDTFPEGAMVLADAGFTGYDVFRAILGSRRRLLIRVGSNVRLLRKLGLVAEAHEGVVYLWTQDARRAGLPPLVLRLISFVGKRNQHVHLLTDVLDPARLTDAQAIEIYGLRWGIEVVYRSIKQTMGRRRMLSDSPAGARAELDGAVIGFWLIGLLAFKRQLGRTAGPSAWSPAKTLGVLRRACDAAWAGRRGPRLDPALAAAHRDEYERTAGKASRHWPAKKRDKPPGSPKARNATELEIKRAAELKETNVAA